MPRFCTASLSAAALLGLTTEPLSAQSYWGGGVPAMSGGPIVPTLVAPWGGGVGPVYPTYGGSYYGPAPAFDGQLTTQVATPWAAGIAPVQPTLGRNFYHETPEYRAWQAARRQPPGSVDPRLQLASPGSPIVLPPAVGSPVAIGAPPVDRSTAAVPGSRPQAAGATQPGLDPRAANGASFATSPPPPAPTPAQFPEPMLLPAVGVQQPWHNPANDPLRMQYGLGVQPLIPLHALGGGWGW